MTQEKMRKTIVPRHWCALYRQRPPRIYSGGGNIVIDETFTSIENCPDFFRGLGDIMISGFSFYSVQKNCVLVFDPETGHIKSVQFLDRDINDVQYINDIWNLTRDDMDVYDAIRLVEFIE